MATTPSVVLPVGPASLRRCEGRTAAPWHVVVGRLKTVVQSSSETQAGCTGPSVRLAGTVAAVDSVAPGVDAAVTSLDLPTQPASSVVAVRASDPAAIVIVLEMFLVALPWNLEDTSVHRRDQAYADVNGRGITTTQVSATTAAAPKALQGQLKGRERSGAAAPGAKAAPGLLTAVPELVGFS